MSLWKNIKTAVRLTGDIRKEQKAGRTVEIRTVWLAPVLKPTYWGSTMESCLMHDREMERAVLAVFRTFPESVQYSLTFSPKGPRGWVERARFWQRELEPALQPKMYLAVMVEFIRWYARCRKMQTNAERAKVTA